MGPSLSEMRLPFLGDSATLIMWGRMALTLPITAFQRSCLVESGSDRAELASPGTVAKDGIIAVGPERLTAGGGMSPGRLGCLSGGVSGTKTCSLESSDQL